LEGYPGSGRAGGRGRSVVEALGGQLFGAVAPELDLHEDLVAVALQGIQGDEGEAAVGDRFLVDGVLVELGGGRDGSLEQGAAPDQGDGSGAAVLAAPAADDVVVEVDLPAGVVLGEDAGEVGLGLEVAGVALLRLDVGDVAEELDCALGALGPGAAGDPDTAAPGTLREPVELAVGAYSLGQLTVLVAGLAEGSRQALGEAAVGNPLLGAVGVTGKPPYSPSVSRRSAAARSGG
jgi:hypothetical protein